MVKKIAAKITNHWVNSKVISSQYSICYSYGLEIILLSALGIAYVIILSLIISTLNTALIFLSVFISLRHFTGGYHANTHLKCQIYLLCTYFICVYISNKANINIYLFFTIVQLIGLFSIWKLCPIPNHNKIISKAQRQINKTKSMCLYVIIGLISLLLKNVSQEIFYVVNVTMLEVIALMAIGFFTERRYLDEITKSNS